MIKFKFTLIALLTFSFFQLPAQDPLEEGWQHFAENDFTAARRSFQKLLNGPQAAQGHLALSLVSAAEGGQLKAGEQHYLDFYRTSSNPQPYIMGLWSMNYGKRSAAQVELLEEIINQESGTLLALARQALGHHYYATGDFRKSEQYFAATGSVKEWSVLGEFENISESGFDKEFGALIRPRPTDVFKNKWGVEVKWFDIKAPLFDNWVDMTYFFYADNSIIYAQNFCQSPTDQEVEFRLGVSGSVKVWVNDKLVFTEADERNNNTDTYRFPVQLKGGNNRILIQLGASEIERCNFLLRITDSSGTNLDNLTFTTQYADYPKASGGTAEVIADETEAFFLNKIEEEPDVMENYLVLSQYYVSNDLLFQAKKILQQARQKWPNSTYLLFQEIVANAKDNNRTVTATLVEELKQKNTTGAQALGYLFDDARESDNLEEMDRIIDQMEAIEGKSTNVLQRRISMANERDQREKMFDLIEQAYELHPNHYRFVYLKFLVESEAKNNMRSGIKVLRRYLEDNYSEEATSQLASAYFQQGDIDRGLNTYAELIENNPIATGYYSRLSGLYYNMGNYRRAEEYLQECLEIAPYVDSYHQTLANSYSEMERNSEAEAAYKKAIYYNPYNYEARRQLRIIQTLPDIFESFIPTDPYALYENAPDASAYPNDNSIILANNIQRLVYPDGGSEEKHTLVVKVFNTDGIDSWKEYSIPVYDNQDGSIEKAEVLKKNGARIEAETNGGYVVFSNLEEGDAIHLTYRLQNYFSGKLANHFWGNHFFELFLPIAQSRLEIKVKSGTQFAYRMENGDLEPRVEKDGGYEHYIWEVKDVPAIQYEPLMPTLADVGATLHYSSLPDWDYIADWYADLAQAKAKGDFEVESVAQELFPQHEQLDDRQKVERIYNYIVKNIRYRSVSFLQSGLIPQKASTTISAKQGDCKDVSTLFVALAATQNIDANLVLVNTRNNGVKEMMLPSIDFNHCIVQLPMDGEDYFVELTSENMPFAASGPSTIGAFALEIPKKGATSSDTEAEILASAVQVPATVSRTSTVSFDGDKMLVNKSNAKTGMAASSMRNTYKNIGEEQQRKNMQEAINREAPGIRLQDLEFISGFDNNAPQVEYRYSYEIPDVFTQISGLYILGLPFADDLMNPSFMAEANRNYPLNLWQYFNITVEEETLDIDIPEGYTLAEVPTSTTVETANIFYELKFTAEGNKLKVSRLFELREDTASADDYTELKQAIEQIVKADSQRIAFKEVE